MTITYSQVQPNPEPSSFRVHSPSNARKSQIEYLEKHARGGAKENNNKENWGSKEASNAIKRPINLGIAPQLQPRRTSPTRPISIPPKSPKRMKRKKKKIRCFSNHQIFFWCCFWAHPAPSIL